MNWTEIADSFEKKLNIPNCVGGVATTVVELPTYYEESRKDEGSYGVLICFVDANMRIQSYQELTKMGRPETSEMSWRIL